MMVQKKRATVDSCLYTDFLGRVRVRMMVLFSSSKKFGTVKRPKNIEENINLDTDCEGSLQVYCITV
jgi:hypothetical protein